ncbi:MAG: NAD-dependent epimerase/dehydratase family protein [Thermoleophilaceae bacterium]
MRVFVAGASGVIGRALLPQLREAGHDVTGMTRSEERARDLRELGAEPVVCDAFDAEGVAQAVAAARPDVVVNELTDIPKAINPRKMGEQFETNDRLRRDGTRNLMQAAEAAGARRLISQSIAFAYAPAGTLRSEEDRFFEDAPDPWGRSIGAVRALEEATLGSERVQGVVLRYGYFYGPGSSYAGDGSTATMVRKRGFPIVGGGTAVYSFIHVDDAAEATVAALDRGAPGIYNVVDDDPAPVSAWLPEYAAALEARPPRKVPRFVARVGGGRLAVYMTTGLQGATNTKAKRELGWEPRWKSWRQGFREALG